MAGIYIHVPYCKTRCVYCDFYTQTNQTSADRYLQALCREIELRNNYLNNEIVETIYWGGGTPSQLAVEQLIRVMDAVRQHFDVSDTAEITLEANPDDLDEEYLALLRQASINRLSIGIQSFDDEELVFLKRRHSSQQAIEAVKKAQDAGFDNISIDLMYGLPRQTKERWLSNIDKAIQLGVQHISAYHLIYEDNTPLMDLLHRGKVQTVDEDLSVDMFSILIDQLKDAGFEHYEISNYAQPGFISRHNSSYWQGCKYAGFGPAAHSYNGISRSWNVSSLKKYIDGIENGKPDAETEVLNQQSRYNEYILTRMRTAWGIDMKELKACFGETLHNRFTKDIARYIAVGNVIESGDFVRFSREGIFISDGIMSDLMMLD